MNKSAKILISAAIAIMLSVCFYVYWCHSQLYPSTDDAYVQAHLVNIAPRVNGQVEAVYVHNNGFVRKGATLFRIDNKPYQIAVDKAQATLNQSLQSAEALEKEVQSAEAVMAERKAELVVAQQNYKRIMTLVKKRSASLADGDTYTSKLRVAEAAYTAAEANLQEAKANLGKHGPDNPKVLQAKAALEQAELDLSYTDVKSPADGFISNLSLRPGDQVNAQQSYFALVENHYWWAQANFKETDLQRIHDGQTASIKIDMYPNKTFKGTVVSLSHGSGSTFSLLPPENASGNWVKVTQRFPVRIKIEDQNVIYPLRMGASCTVEINTTHHAS